MCNSYLSNYNYQLSEVLNVFCFYFHEYGLTDWMQQVGKSKCRYYGCFFLFQITTSTLRFRSCIASDLTKINICGRHK